MKKRDLQLKNKVKNNGLTFIVDMIGYNNNKGEKHYE